MSSLSPPLLSLPTFSRSTNAVSPTTSAVVSTVDGGSILASAALYLYTFLATLILLVSISAFIVIRSIIQRRRRSQAVQEALVRFTNGANRVDDLELVRMVGAVNRIAVVDLTKQPEIWEIHLAPEGKDCSSWRLYHQACSLAPKLTLPNGSVPYLDPKPIHSLPWSWSSIFPLSCTPFLPDGATGDGDKQGLLHVNLNEGRTVPLTGMARIFDRILYGHASVPGSRHGNGTEAGRQPVGPSITTPSTSNPNTDANRTVDLNTNTSTTERANSDVINSTDQRPGVTSLLSVLEKQTSGERIKEGPSTRTRVVVLVRMPTPPPLTSRRLSASSLASTVDDKVVPIPPLEVGVADVDVFGDSDAGEGGGAIQER